MQGPYHYQAITLGVTPHYFAFLSYSLLASGGLEDIAGFNLVPRWNTIGKTEAFFADVNQLYVNRLLYALLAMGAIIITIIWYGRKRRGGGLHGKKH